MRTNILYLSYTGMTDTLGESQVLSYMLDLAKLDYNIHIVSAEKKDLYLKNRDRIQEKSRQAVFPGILSNITSALR